MISLKALKMKHHYFLLLTLFWIPVIAICQHHPKIKINGTVFNAETRKPLGFVQIVSYESMLSYSSDRDGNFLIYLSETDSIKIVSMGFEGIIMKVKDFLKASERDSVFLKPATYMIQEVTVRAEKREIRLNLPGNIGTNVDPDADPNRSIPAPSIGMILNPMSLAYSVFSKEAKSQRKLQKTIEHQREMSAWEEVISSGMLRDWIEIEEDQLEKFIIFCNQNIQTHADDNLLTLRTKVLKLWEDYNQQTVK
jgi:hypothetical protein